MIAIVDRRRSEADGARRYIRKATAIHNALNTQYLRKYPIDANELGVKGKARSVPLFHV